VWKYIFFWNWRINFVLNLWNSGETQFCFKFVKVRGDSILFWNWWIQFCFKFVKVRGDSILVWNLARQFWSGIYERQWVSMGSHGMKLKWLWTMWSMHIWRPVRAGAWHVAREHVVVLTATGEWRHMGHDFFFIARHLFRHSLWNLWLHVVVAVGHHSSAWQHTGQSSILAWSRAFGWLAGRALWPVEDRTLFYSAAYIAPSAVRVPSSLNKELVPRFVSAKVRVFHVYRSTKSRASRPARASFMNCETKFTS